MLQLFKHNTLAQVVVIIVTTLLLWLCAFVNPTAQMGTEHYAPLYTPLCHWLDGLPRLASVLALLLVLVEAIWLNLMLHNHKVMRNASLLPTLLFLLAMSWGHAGLTLTPIVVANLMLLAATGQLLSDGGTQLSTERNFNASFCIGLAALFYLPMLSYVLPLLIVFFTYKMYRWRHFAVSLLGIIAPWLLFFLCTFMAGTLETNMEQMAEDIVSVALRHDAQAEWPWTVNVVLSNLIFVLLLAAGLLHLLGTGNDNVTYMRINTRVLTLPLLAAVGIALYNRLFPFNTQAAAIPFVFLIETMLNTPRKRAWINETLFWILYVGAIL